MSHEVIRVENLSKLYDLGQVGTGTVTRDLNRWWAKTRGKEDPYTKIGMINDRTQKPAKDESVWALRDINFSVNQGEILGIIGRNGAGKSTLLKIISRITTPTKGAVKVKGRIASLLEVGTGFHPEMTGRENIFMNGTLMGMTRKEIQNKFDEIVDFAGVAMYIDTPVKRYSSGMQVRLGFAVAAFLEPEILIVDEVLAVGDAEFQKKAIGRMKEVSKGDGRTVLFVSHNMVSVKALCTNGILLKNGELFAQDKINEIVRLYQEGGVSYLTEQNWEIGIDAPGNDKIKIKRAAVFAESKASLSPIMTTDSVVMEFDFFNLTDKINADITIDVFDSESAHVARFGMVFSKQGLPKGLHRTRGVIPGNLLNARRYIFHVTFGLNQREILYRYEDILAMDIEDAIEGRGNNFVPFPGVVHPIIKLETSTLG